MPPTDRRPRPIALFVLLLGAATIGLVLALPEDGRANGGTLRLGDVPIGNYRMSVFTDPTPVRPDSLDVSVLVLHEDRPGPVDDVDVTVRSRALENQGPGSRLPATKGQADDPRYYAAKFVLGAEGRWEIDVHLDGPEGSGSAAFQITAREPGLLGHPLVLTLLALLPLAGFGAWLFRQNPGSDEDESVTRV